MGHRILVVEDSAVIRRLIEVCLRAGDVEIITREDGPGGLEAVTRSRPTWSCSISGCPAWMAGRFSTRSVRSPPLAAAGCRAHGPRRRGVPAPCRRGRSRRLHHQAVPAERLPRDRPRPHQIVDRRLEPLGSSPARRHRIHRTETQRSSTIAVVNFIIKVLVNAAALWVAARFVPGNRARRPTSGRSC